MKKVFNILLITLALCLLVSGCGTTSADGVKNEDVQSSVPTQTEPVATEESTLPSEETTAPTEQTEATEPPHEHEFTEEKTDATCSTEGLIIRSCECGHSEEEVIPMLEHAYEEKVVKPTYVNKGYTEYTCTSCGDTYKDNYTDVVPHDHKYKTITTKPNCTDKGYTNHKCEFCGHSYNDAYVDATGHNYTKKTVEPTYTEKGYDLYTCSTCKKTYKDNYTDVVPHEHDYEEKVTSPTCTKGGYTTGKCKLCGHEKSKYNETSALGHDYVTKTVKPTAKEKGYDVHTCSRCNDSYKDNYTDPVITYTEVDETVYANTTVNIRKGPSTDYEKIGQLTTGQSIKRVAIGDNGWSKVEYNGEIAYMFSDYLQTTKPPVANSGSYPMTYSDGSCTITIYKEWYENAYVYAAHLQFSDYSRFGTDCANGKYNNGYETTSHAAKRLGAIFAVNGCYSAPYLDYTVVRGGKIWNGANRNLCLPGIYSSKNGLLRSGWEGSQGTAGISGRNVQELVDAGELTDTFCFGPPGLINGSNVSGKDTSRAQRTFIGTNGNPGDIWVCVSDGRYNDGKSAGLTFSQAMDFLITKGCTYGVHLDGGGSSTMYFNGKVLNAANGNQRAVVDFVYFK